MFLLVVSSLFHGFVMDFHGFHIFLLVFIGFVEFFLYGLVTDFH